MRVLILALLLLLPARLTAQAVEVDVELFLAVDVSRSMSVRDLEIQRQGYAAALTSDPVMAAVASGLLGRIAVTYVEWAGAGSQRVVVPWVLIETRADAAAVAGAITDHWGGGMRRTSISSALTYAAASIEGNAYKGLRRVIDVSGDGPNNEGVAVTTARDAALATGIIINGIPLMTQDDFARQFSIPDLDAYYRACVIGGPGAFVIPVLKWEDFERAVRAKLVLEIAGRAVPARSGIIRVQAGQAADYDCLIGEKLWQRNRFDFNMP